MIRPRRRQRGTRAVRTLLRTLRLKRGWRHLGSGSRTRNDLHRIEKEVPTVVVVLDNLKLAQLRELHLEGVATTVQHVGELLQLPLRSDAVVEDGVLDERLRTGLVDEHANAFDSAKLGANLGVMEC